MPTSEFDFYLDQLANKRFCCVECELKRRMRLAAALDARYAKRWEI